MKCWKNMEVAIRRMDSTTMLPQRTLSFRLSVVCIPIFIVQVISEATGPIATKCYMYFRNMM